MLTTLMLKYGLKELQKIILLIEIQYKLLEQIKQNMVFILMELMIQIIFIIEMYLIE